MWEAFSYGGMKMQNENMKKAAPKVPSREDFFDKCEDLASKQDVLAEFEERLHDCAFATPEQAATIARGRHQLCRLSTFYGRCALIVAARSRAVPARRREPGSSTAPAQTGRGPRADPPIALAARLAFRGRAAAAASIGSEPARLPVAGVAAHPALVGAFVDALAVLELLEGDGHGDAPANE